MRTTTRAAAALLTAALALCAAMSHAQNVHHGDSFELSDTLNPRQSHEYTANDFINLNRGFLSSPNPHKNTVLQLDPSGIYPPDAGLTGGPNTSDTGVVGALGGMVDVGLMGAAIYSIPLELPSGINGMQPKLAITYNSQAGNGLLGWGWDITGLSLIERTGRTRYHDGASGCVTMDDETDRFMLDGVRLITVADYTDSIEFKAEQDNMSRIMAYYEAFMNTGMGGAPLYTLSCFKVWKSDGHILEYGSAEDSRLTLQTTGSMALCWLLNRELDRNGNSVTYHYNIHPETGEYYISSIKYTEHSENGTVTVGPEFTVDFQYRSQNRKDYDFRYVAGSIVQSRKMLDYISVIRDASNEELERYSFTYRIDSVADFYQDVRMHSRLNSILFEKDGVRLNPTKISWAYDTCSNVWTFDAIADTAIFHNYPFVGDFNGDGYSDLAVVPYVDSVYTHNVDVNFFMNNPANPGHFVHDDGMTLQGVDRRLDWIYPADLNDDGLDDLVVCFYDSIAQTGSETMDVVVLENVGGTHFVAKDTVSIDNGRYLIRTGDFIGNGKTQMLIVPLCTFLSFSNPILVYHNGSNYQQALSNSVLLNIRDVTTGDFNGDGVTDMLIVKENESIVCSLRLSGNGLTYVNRFNTDEINHAGRWNHLFSGDFNGDGKTDLLYNDTIRHNNNSNVFHRWRVFYSTGMSFSASRNIVSLGNYVLPEYNLYSNSLRKVIDFYSVDGSSNIYSVCVADFDGDGVSDVAGIQNNYSIYYAWVYFCFNPTEGKFMSYFTANSAPHGNYYFNCRNQYLHVGNFKGRENLSFLGLEYRNTSHTNNRPGVFSLKPTSELNNVSIVIDGLDNPVGFAYGYVQQPYQELGNGVRCVPVPIRTLKAITTYNASDRQMRTLLGYSDPCHHRDGHGWLGFRKQVWKTLEDGEETARTVRMSSLGTMSTHAMLLPEADTSYVFPGGDRVLSEVTTYQFDKVLSGYGYLNADRLVVCPALTAKTVVRYDPDSPGDILSKTFTKNHYSHTNGFYNHAYHCNATLTGVGGASAAGLSGCEFLAKDSTVYCNNEYVSWTLNKPRKSISVRSRAGKPDVTLNRKYEYTSEDSYQLSRVIDIPHNVYSQDHLSTQTDYGYYSDGNLMSETVQAPYAQLGEQQRTVEYEYDEGHRMVARETVGSGSLSYSTSYAYDDYDRIDTLTGANGLATVYQSDAFGITTWTTNADGMKTCLAKRWAEGHPLAPSNAMYYTWTRSSDGIQTLVFYHKTGAELRSVSYGLHGEPIIIDRQYDDRGRLYAVSDPYKEGGTPHWTTYGYDDLDRPTSVTTPDTTCTATVYDGFRTETTVTPLTGTPQTSSVTVNVMGWTVRSDDASGSYVTYDHYADGLMASATVNGNSSTMVTASYDHARRRDTITDPDYGTLVTVYDAYGRLKSSASPRESAAQTQTTCVYDGLDRVVSVTDGLEGTLTQYSYNETGVTKGTLDEILFKKQAGADIQRIHYDYDALARPKSIVEQRGAAQYETLMDYDSQSRVNRLVYPSGVTVRYGYHRGYLKNVTDDNGNLLWRTSDMDASGQLLEARMGNGAVTNYVYDTLMHRLERIVTTKNLQNLTYGYDNFGNLASRKDNIKNMEETFTYDGMNRLTGVTLKRPSGQDLVCSVTYDALGRMTSRQAVTAENGVPQVTSVFSQPVFDPTKVHALASATTTEELFPSDDQTVTYTGFDKVGKVKQGSDSLCYTYGYDRQRILMVEHVGSLTRTKQYWGACEYVTESDGATTAEYCLTYLTGPTGVYAVVVKGSDGDAVHYVLKDNLGSWTTITDESGTVEQRLSYDAWGNLRDPNTWANYTVGDTFDKPMFDRGFTGHEHLTDFGLINMNGRVYDPVMSSFLSADRFVQNPLTAQGFNRYSYCMNNPLRYVDPTGWEYGYGGGSSYPRLSAPKSPLSLIQDYLSDPCYITRQQLREAGIYDIEGGYGFYGGGGTMDASWMEGDGSVHHSSWSVRTEGGGFNAGAWAIPVSFNPMWENQCQGFCDYGGMSFENARVGIGVTTGNYFASVLNGSYYAITNHYSVEKNGVLPLDVDNDRGFGVSQLAHYYMGYTVTVSNVFDNKKHLFSNDQICINISGMSSHTLVSGDVFSSAKAFLYVDDNLIDSKPFVIDSQIVVLNPLNVSYIGSALFVIPASGNIVLQIQGGWRIYTGTGWVVPNATIFGPTINANKTIEIKL